MTRRAVVFMVTATALLLSLTAGPDAAPNVRGADGGVGVPRAVLAVEASVRAKAEILASGKIEHRTVKSRLRLGLAVLAGLSAMSIFGMAGLHRLRPRPGLTQWRRSSVTLRAPPVLRLS